MQGFRQKPPRRLTWNAAPTRAEGLSRAVLWVVLCHETKERRLTVARAAGACGAAVSCRGRVCGAGRKGGRQPGRGVEGAAVTWNTAGDQRYRASGRGGGRVRPWSKLGQWQRERKVAKGGGRPSCSCSVWGRSGSGAWDGAILECLLGLSRRCVLCLDRRPGLEWRLIAK